MNKQESECWKSAQLWHERALKAEAKIEELRAEVEQLEELLWQEAGNRVEIARLRDENKRLKRE